MRTCTLLLPIILWASTAAGQLLEPGPGAYWPWPRDPCPGGHLERDPAFGDWYCVPDPGTPSGPVAGPPSANPWPVFSLPELPQATLTLPATTPVTTPVDISFMPQMPTPQDEVVMTITGWKQVATHVVDRLEVRTEGRDIFVDVYWIDTPPPPPLWTPQASGNPWDQVWMSTVEQVPHAQLTATFQKYEITGSLGTFEPGTYTVHVTNRGVMSGDTSASFTVRDRGSSIELDSSFWPYWLLPLR